MLHRYDNANIDGMTMREVTDEEFDQLIQRALSELPPEYIQNLDNVAITYADDPTQEQLVRNHVDHDHLLLGLYEGLPQTSRYAASYTGVLPDKITIFKNPIRYVTYDDASFFEQIKRTVWHEIAHHYGLGHDRIDVIERRQHGEQI